MPNDALRCRPRRRLRRVVVRQRPRARFRRDAVASVALRPHGQRECASPAPLATPRATARRLNEYRGVPRSPRGHKNPRGSRLAVCSMGLHRVRCGSSCQWRGVCPQNIATVAIAALCALSGAHVGVSRPRCRWQLYGWRHPTTPSREPHERSSYQDPCRHWPEGRFCRLSLPVSRQSAPRRRPDSDRRQARLEPPLSATGRDSVRISRSRSHFVNRPMRAFVT